MDYRAEALRRRERAWFCFSQRHCVSARVSWSGL